MTNDQADRDTSPSAPSANGDHTKPRLKVLIVGAGLGGLAAACSLRPFAEVTVSIHSDLSA